MNANLKKALAMIFAVSLTASSVSVMQPITVSAETKTLEQIEKEKKEKQAQINAKKAQLATLLDLITDDKINQSITDYVISEYGLPEDDDQY